VTQLTSLQRHSQPLQRRKRLRPKTYSVAVYLVGAVILLQVAMVIIAFWLRAMVVSVNVNLPKALTTATGNPNPPVPSSSGTPNNPGPPRLPGLNALPVLLKVPGASDELAQVDTLNEEAQVFLRQNDFPSALDLPIRAIPRP